MARTNKEINEVQSALDQYIKESSFVVESNYNPQEHRDATRSQIALYFVKGYFALVVFIFVFTFIYNLVVINLGHEAPLDILEVFTTVSGALSGLIGFVLGYYFKSEEGK
jgi:hypothetical protein